MGSRDGEIHKKINKKSGIFLKSHIIGKVIHLSLRYNSLSK